MIRGPGLDNDLRHVSTFTDHLCLFHCYAIAAGQHKVDAIVMILRIIGRSRRSPRTSGIRHFIEMSGSIRVDEASTFQCQHRRESY